MRWDELPEIEEVRRELLALADAKAHLRMCELELTIAQALIAKAAPRNTAARIIGVDDATREKLLQLHSQVIDAKNQLDRIQADVDFSEYRKDACKITSYKGRGL